VLRPDLKAREFCLVLLYQRGAKGATYAEMYDWARTPMRANLHRTLDALANEKLWLHRSGERYIITSTGRREVEKRGWLDPI
jgi:hypothetical protein